MTSAPNKWKGIYFTDAKPASACPRQMGSQISWLQFQRNAGSLSDRELVWSPDLSQESPRSSSVAAPTFPAAINGPETRSKRDGNHHELLIPFCCYQGSYALDYSISEEVLLITDSVPNVCLLTVRLRV